MSPQDRIAELEEEVTQLKRMLHVAPEERRVAALMDGLSLTNHQALILAALYDAGSAWMTAERLSLVLPERLGGDPRSLAVIHVHICRLRAKLGADAILGRYYAGWTLGAPGIEAARRALSGSADKAP